MVFSEYILKYPYTLIWKILKLFKKNKEIIFYCDDELDYICFKNDLKYLPEVKIIAKNKKVQNDLLKYNIHSEIYPAFPDVLIMARHSLHKFPAKDIYKIGVRHGVYHFKNFIAAEKFNRFDVYFMTSKTEVEEAKQHGIKTAASCSFPKNDDLFDEECIVEFNKFRKTFDEKEILLFSATWDKSGVSAVEKWYDKLDLLKDKYNILVTLHPWISEEYINKIKSYKNVYFIDEKDINRYLYISDYLVGDTSSIIGEYCCLKKPIITFRVPVKGRLVQNIVDMLEDMTYRIDNFDEIEKVIESIKSEGDKKLNIYDKYINIMYDMPLGEMGKKRAEMIKELIDKNT